MERAIVPSRCGPGSALEHERVRSPMRRCRSVGVIGAAMAIALTLVPSLSASRKTENAGCTLHILGSTRANKAESDGWNKVFADFKAQYGCTVTATWSGQFTDVPRMLNEARL